MHLVDIIRFFEHEIIRVYQILRGGDLSESQRKLYQKVLSKGGIMSPRKLQRSGGHYDTAEKAEKELNGLKDLGFGEWLSPKGLEPFYEARFCKFYFSKITFSYNSFSGSLLAVFARSFQPSIRFSVLLLGACCNAQTIKIIRPVHSQPLAIIRSNCLKLSTYRS